MKLEGDFKCPYCGLIMNHHGCYTNSYGAIETVCWEEYGGCGKEFLVEVILPTEIKFISHTKEEWW